MNMHEVMSQMFGRVKGRPFHCALLGAWILFHLLQLKYVYRASELNRCIVFRDCEVASGPAERLAHATSARFREKLLL